MCGNMADIQSARLRLSEEKEERRKKEARNHSMQNIMACPLLWAAITK